MSGAGPISFPEQQKPVSAVSLAWFLKRTLLGVTILLLAVGTFACLLYASIEPDRAEAASPTPAASVLTDPASLKP